MKQPNNASPKTPSRGGDRQPDDPPKVTSGQWAAMRECMDQFAQQRISVPITIKDDTSAPDVGADAGFSEETHISRRKRRQRLSLGVTAVLGATVIALLVGLALNRQPAPQAPPFGPAAPGAEPRAMAPPSRAGQLDPVERGAGQRPAQPKAERSTEASAAGAGEATGPRGAEPLAHPPAIPIANARSTAGTLGTRTPAHDHSSAAAGGTRPSAGTARQEQISPSSTAA